MSSVTTLKSLLVRENLRQEDNNVSIVVDFEDTNVSANTYVDLFDLPTLNGVGIITDLIVETQTAEGAAGTLDIGLRPASGTAFTASNDGLETNANLNVVGVAQGTIGTDSLMGKEIDLSGGAKVFCRPSIAVDASKVRITIKNLLF